MISSVLAPGVSSISETLVPNTGLSRVSEEQAENTGDATDEKPLRVCLTIFVFRGCPDTYFNRHVMAHFTSPDDPGLYETIHTQRMGKGGPWKVFRVRGVQNWFLTNDYLSHVNAGAMVVPSGQELAPVEIVASTPVEGRDQDSGWNCQNFVLEGLQEMVRRKLQTQEWYDSIEGELIDQLLEGAVP